MEIAVTAAGKTVKLKASALTPRLYRAKFGRDLLMDIGATISGDLSEDSPPALEIYENIAYIMARQADSSIGDDVARWLDSLDLGTVYELIPSIVNLWAANTATTSEAKKNDV